MYQKAECVSRKFNARSICLHLSKPTRTLVTLPHIASTQGKGPLKPVPSLPCPAIFSSSQECCVLPRSEGAVRSAAVNEPSAARTNGSVLCIIFPRYYSIMCSHQFGLLDATLPSRTIALRKAA